MTASRSASSRAEPAIAPSRHASATPSLAHAPTAWPRGCGARGCGVGDGARATSAARCGLPNLEGGPAGRDRRAPRPGVPFRRGRRRPPAPPAQARAGAAAARQRPARPRASTALPPRCPRSTALRGRREAWRAAGPQRARGEARRRRRATRRESRKRARSDLASRSRALERAMTAIRDHGTGSPSRPRWSDRSRAASARDCGRGRRRRAGSRSAGLRRCSAMRRARRPDP